ncbi:MAG: hypothetical protein VXW22_00645 [Pseudomonadota bacterium]|nr:hypothetical protein [Pseudomonadota bacterium]
MRYFIAAAAGGILTAGIFAMPASASYMQKCSKLISAWEACQETGGDCSVQQAKIEEQCKCHVQKGDDWKLVNAAVEKDDVCGHPPEDITLPPPPPPPPTRVRPQPDHGDKADDKDKAGEKGDNAGRKSN